jgi:uncharacterized protein (TIGR00255 family)
MTGFAQRSFDFDSGHFRLEIRSVNHKYLEISVRLPASCMELEMLVRSRIEAVISRGKIDFYLHGSLSGLNTAFAVDFRQLEQYMSCVQQLGERYEADTKMSVAELLSLPGCVKEMPVEAGMEGFLAAFTEALDCLLPDFIESRRKEGSFLAAGLQDILQDMEKIRLELEDLASGFEKDALERLRNRMDKIRAEVVDEHRLYMELGFLLEKLDIAEELLRLKSHLQRFSELLCVAGDSGRTMGFLCQEIHREINTIGSKSQNMEISTRVVDFKSLLEKVREQVQNIE